MSRAVLVLSALLLTALGPAAPASAQRKYRSTSVAAPSYPESRLAMRIVGHPRARGIATLRVSGSNASRDDGDGLAFGYTLDVYVHDRSVFKSCARSLREANSRQASVPSKTEHIGLGLDIPASGPFSHTIRFETEAFRRLILCAYTTYVVDDAAMASLKHDLRKARRRG